MPKYSIRFFSWKKVCYLMFIFCKFLLLCDLFNLFITLNIATPFSSNYQYLHCHLYHILSYLVKISKIPVINMILSSFFIIEDRLPVRFLVFFFTSRSLTSAELISLFSKIFIASLTSWSLSISISFSSGIINSSSPLRCPLSRFQRIQALHCLVEIEILDEYHHMVLLRVLVFPEFPLIIRSFPPCSSIFY